jgi:DNA-directed RNA polymerase beta' subunit
MSKDIGGGAKGDTMNVTQMKSGLFQQHIFGGRPPLQITGGTRALCTFEEGSKALEAHGCVFQSFSEGLTPDGFFFHQASSRQGLVDTSVKTAETGQLQHDMVKAFEGLMVHYDGSVRDNIGTIVQFAYGNDGFDGSQLVNVPTGTQKEMATFVDLKMMAARHNVRRGWIPGKSKKPILIQQRQLLRQMRLSGLEPSLE